MSQITPFAAGSFNARETARMFVEMRKASETFERQMATGQKSDTYSGLGYERRTSLDVRARLSSYEAYAETMRNANLRLDVRFEDIETLETIVSRTRSTALEPLSGTGDGSVIARRQDIARNDLAFAVEIFNTDVNGRHVFAGRATDTPPMDGYQDIFADLRTAVAGLTAPGDILTAVENYFNTPADWRPAGADGSTPARESVLARVDENQSVAIGARPDEPGFRGLLVGLGALAAADESVMSEADYAALSNAVADRLAANNPLPRDVATDLGRAQATIGAVKERQDAGAALLRDALDDVELISTEEAAVSLLNLQTRLQASFQTTAILSRQTAGIRGRSLIVNLPGKPKAIAETLDELEIEYLWLHGGTTNREELVSRFQQKSGPPVFLISAAIVVLFVAWGVLAPGNLGDIANGIMNFITVYFGWWYVAAMTGFVVFVLVLMFSPYGRIKIGKDHEEPEWSTWGWFSMLFTAGMGIGLVFYGVAEPIFHFNSPPVGEGGTAEAAVTAMNITFFHWGVHPWAMYIIVGLSMGYFCFRHDLPLRPASAFYPLIGNAVYGKLGNAIDILAVFGTLFGLATSLGLGATQINSGLNAVFGLPVSAGWQVIIIGVVTAIAVASPPPMQSDATPRLPPVCLNACSSVTRMRAPLQPMG